MYFDDCHTLDELKRKFHKYAFKYHSDTGKNGGNEPLFVKIIEEYNSRKADFTNKTRHHGVSHNQHKHKNNNDYLAEMVFGFMKNVYPEYVEKAEKIAEKLLDMANNRKQ